MDEGKSAVRVARKNLGMTHSTNLPENDIFQRIFFFLPETLYQQHKYII